MLILRTAGALAGALTLAVLTACSSDDSDRSGPVEGHDPSPRLVVASDGRLDVLDATDLESLGSFETTGAAKLSVAGDERHVFAMESEAELVRVLDTGTWTEAHGDHGHSWTADPVLHETVLDGLTYHAVSDEERAVIWWDEEGAFSVLDLSELADGRVEAERVEAGEPHHGVAGPRPDGSFVASTALDGEAVGIVTLDARGAETGRWQDCPGLHGEAHLPGGGYVFGCSTGVLVSDESGVRPVASPVAGAGTGALVADPELMVAAGTLSSDSDDPSLATQVALYDLVAGTSESVDLGVEFNSLALGEKVAVTVGTDGALHVVDLLTGRVDRIADVVDPWVKPEDWKEPKPQVAVAGHLAWISDPNGKQIIRVDLESGEVLQKSELSVVPTSLVVVNAGGRDH